MFLQWLDIFAEAYLKIKRRLIGIHGNIILGDKVRLGSVFLGFFPSI